MCVKERERTFLSHLKTPTTCGLASGQECPWKPPSAGGKALWGGRGAQPQGHPRDVPWALHIIAEMVVLALPLLELWWQNLTWTQLTEETPQPQMCEPNSRGRA